MCEVCIVYCPVKTHLQCGKQEVGRLTLMTLFQPFPPLLLLLLVEVVRRHNQSVAFFRGSGCGHQSMHTAA